MWSNYVAPAQPGARPSKPAADAPTKVKLADFVERLRSIDTQSCPQDFQLAFLTHVQAYERKLAFVNRAPDDPLGSLLLIGASLYGVVPPAAGLTGFNSIVNQNSQARAAADGVEDQVRESGFALERVALKYGVRMRTTN